MYRERSAIATAISALSLGHVFRVPEIARAILGKTLEPLREVVSKEKPHISRCRLITETLVEEWEYVPPPEPSGFCQVLLSTPNENVFMLILTTDTLSVYSDE